MLLDIHGTRLQLKYNSPLNIFDPSTCPQLDRPVQDWQPVARSSLRSLDRTVLSPTSE
jgi:hypothetical protein